MADSRGTQDDLRESERKLTIGGLELGGRLCLAPLAGVTTVPVRRFFSQHGAFLTHTEMISCAGLIRENAKTFDMLAVDGSESPLVVQLFGNDEGVLVSGGEVVMKRCEKFSAFGINMACPMPKITKNGCGSALLKKPELAQRMTRGLKSLGLPVWVKIRRLEIDDDTLRFVDGLVTAGADNVCIHGRTPSQRYEGRADRTITSKAANEFPGMISASGDVREVSDIEEYLASGCAAVMIARGAFSNPFIFEEYAGHFRSRDEKIEELVNFARKADEISGGHKALVLMKRFAGSMLKFERGSAEMRQRAMMSTSLEDIINIFTGGMKQNVDRI
ncbi:MAG: tRNA-dihydrouridine synthase family protein [Synergistaceae bacterium]|nr:tRNA-dihydrouridine synthase family protein [Synergistaceae bacterium]